ncbi:unnamed protein product [Cuscuta europaea]|uniref:Uncharacterized protein n=1 Tax=Cuscuta europaea TaxID=41803 RepID=A0A9P0ZJA1_CUSEU|nr:unnamed protein product [Cuscuta europaea]
MRWSFNLPCVRQQSIAEREGQQTVQWDFPGSKERQPWIGNYIGRRWLAESVQIQNSRPKCWKPFLQLGKLGLLTGRRLAPSLQNRGTLKNQFDFNIPFPSPVSPLPLLLFPFKKIRH